MVTQYTTVLDALPLWSLFAVIIVLVLAAIEGGYRLGRYRHRRSDGEKDAPVGTMVGATLGLLAFMLAFTFGMAASRFKDSSSPSGVALSASLATLRNWPTKTSAAA